MKSEKADFVVIGAGVFGVWTAYALRKHGHTVLLLDAYGAGNNRSSSGDESRIIRMGYGSDQLYTRWAARSLEAWQELFRACKQHLFLKTGVLWLSTVSDPYTRLISPTLTANSIPHEKVSASEISARFPQIGIDDVDSESLASKFRNPEAEHSDRELQTLVRRAVARLGKTAGEMFVLRYYEGHDNQEIALLMKTSSLVVGVTLHRARTKLRKEIGHYLEKHHEKQ